MKNRSIKTLLTILRDQIQNKESIGLGICHEISLIRIADLITEAERDKLEIFMNKNRPKRGIHYNAKQKQFPYWWPKGQKDSRIAWLNSKIEKK